MSPRRFNFAEPLVMLATVLQWLVLATVTGVVVGTGTSAFLNALYALMAVGRALVLVWISVLLPLAGLINGLLLYYGYRANRTGLKDTLMVAVHTQEGMMPLKTLLIKPVAALVTRASGGSAGKEA